MPGRPPVGGAGRAAPVSQCEPPATARDSANDHRRRVGPRAVRGHGRRALPTPENGPLDDAGGLGVSQKLRERVLVQANVQPELALQLLG